ncbi:hypothetical protein E3P99_02348 [Wallemia hederae]|uniref:DNA mismatch repair protein S5 domain-containing protein n=1 Tax=Wallemia hederae TaxID=1540922 RepID=A0A4T0FJW2_9BASI|nr:hypothetical protein E3P99_02348 [Wallemia hederae]
MRRDALHVTDTQFSTVSQLQLSASPSCVDIYKERLLVGYDSGLLEIYSTANYKLLNAIKQCAPKSIVQGTDEGHLPNVAITKAYMVNSHSLISADISNKVFYTSFRGIQQLKWLDGLDKLRLYGNYTNQTPSHKSVILHVLSFNKHVSILTPSKLIIISLSPAPSTVHRILNMSYSPNTHGNLAYSHNTLIYNWSNTLYRVDFKPDEITSTHHAFNLHITSCHWIGSVILLRSPTHLHLVHPDTFDVIESHSFSMPTESFQVVGKSCYFTSDSKLQKATLLNYKSRLNDLILENRPIEALQLALHFYNGQVGHQLTTQLPDASSQRQQLIIPYIETLLRSSTRYLELTIRSQSTEALNYIAKLLIDASIILDTFDTLFQDSFDIYQSARQDEVFLLQLEPYVRKGSVGSVPPHISQLLLRLYDPQSQAERYEELVLRLNPVELDINGVIKATRYHKLWRAYIYVHITALGDFVTPFLCLLNVIREAGHENGEISEVSTLYEYVGHTLSDLVYPTQKALLDLDEDASERGISTRAKTDLYTLIFSARLHPDDPQSPQSRSNSQPSTPSLSLSQSTPRLSHSPSLATSYPYVHQLLSINPRLFFAVLNTGFEDAYFNVEHTLPLSRQTIVNILLEMVYTQDLHYDTITQIEVFVSSNISKYPQFILLPSSTILRLLMGLSEEHVRVDAEGKTDVNNTGVSHLERELAVQSLLTTFTPTTLTKIQNEMCQTFEKAKFYKILKSIYRSRAKFTDFVRVVLEDQGEDSLFRDLHEAFKACSRGEQGDGDTGALFEVFEPYVDDIVALSPDAFVDVVEKYARDPNAQHATMVSWMSKSMSKSVYLRTVLNTRGDETTDELKMEYVTLLAQSQHYTLSHSNGADSSDIDTNTSDDICAVIDKYTFDTRSLHALFDEYQIIDAQMHLLDKEGKPDEAFGCLRATSFRDHHARLQIEAVEKGTALAIKHTNKAESSDDSTRMWLTVLTTAIHVIQWHSLSNDVLETTLNGLLMHTMHPDDIKYSSLLRDILNHFHHTPTPSPPHHQFRTVLFMFMESIRCRLEIFTVGARIMDTECARQVDAYGKQSRRGWRAATQYRKELHKLKEYVEKSEELQLLADELDEKGVEWRGMFEVPEITARSIKVYQKDASGTELSFSVSTLLTPHSSLLFPSPPSSLSMDSSRIRRLDESVVNRIAAGEIIHRPANALKELMENSLDAGSTNIKVTVKEGGLKLLQIQDNGRGIDKEDLPILCQRFTTSKIKEYDDLQSVSTFGFRGEALASISHVAHLSVLTKRDGDKAGWRYSDGEQVEEPAPAAGNRGTTITVQDLFFNVPMRRRALKSANEEYARIVDVVTRYAVHYPTVSFVCKKANANVPDVSTLSKSSTQMNIKALFGPQVAKELLLLECSNEALDYKCTGYATSTNYASKRTTMLVFINHRLVDCPSLKRNIENAYSALLPKGSHPFVYLSLEIPAQNIDVNVHPTKSQVHFINEDDIIETIAEALGTKLAASNTSKSYDVQTYLPKPKPVATISNPSFLSSIAKPPPKSQIRTDGMTRTLDSFIPVTQIPRQTQTQSQSQSQPAEVEAEAEAEGVEEDADSDVEIVGASTSFTPITQKTAFASTSASASASKSVHSSAPRPSMSSTPLKRRAEGGDATQATPLLQSSQSMRTPVEKVRGNKVNLTSVQHLRRRVLDEHNDDAGHIVRNNAFVGFVDMARHLALVQHNTELLMLDYDKFAWVFCYSTVFLITPNRFELFYQIALNQFGNMAKFELDPPPNVRQLVAIALKTEEDGIVECGGSYEEVLDKIVDLLTSRAGMLDEYFGITISEQGNLTRLPLLLKDYTPNIDALPSLLMNMGPLVNWNDELECFDGILKQIAAFYIPSGTDDEASRWQIQHVLFQSIAKNLTPSHALAQNAVTQVTSLPALYRIFERC